MAGPAILSQLTGDDARARRADGLTSQAAADSISAEALEASEVEVLTILREAGRPVTAEAVERRHAQRVWQLNGVHQYSPSRLRTAVAQLKKKGAVVEDGVGKTTSGRAAKTMRLAMKGEA
jgi:hypothetical protein